MNIITKQTPDKDLTVTIEYPEMNSAVDKLIGKIQSCDLTINCISNGAITPIEVDRIYYIEAVDRRTFIYTDRDVYQCEYKLHEIEEIYKGTGLVRINKACLINIDNLYSVKQLMNSQLEALMQNGEKLIVARTYLKSIKNLLKGEK